MRSFLLLLLLLASDIALAQLFGPPQNYQSVGNSSTATLAGGATFGGAWEDVSAFNETVILVQSDVPSAINGLVVQYSDNCSTVVDDDMYSIPANDSKTYITHNASKCIRVRYTNGTSAQGSFSLKTTYVPTATKPSNHRIRDAISLEDDAELVKSNLEDVSLAMEDRAVAADRAIFGSAVVSNRISHIIAQFDVSVAQNDLSTSVSGGAATPSTSGGRLTVATGTATTASAAIFTNRNIRYAPGREIYAQFTAAFTTPTSANSTQRAGMYDANNGFFIRMTTAGLAACARSATVDTCTTSASWNGDKLDGTALSRFTRGAVQEAINFTFMNVYRIRFGWLGSAPVEFQVMAPDKRWVTFHTIKQPNLAATPVIQNPNLTIRMEAVKASADAQNVQMFSSSWDGGTVEDAASFGPEDVKGRKYVTAMAAAFTADTTIYTVGTGRTLRITGGNVSCFNSDLLNSGLLMIRDGSSGTQLFPISMASATNQSASQIPVPFTLPTGLKFTNAVYADEQNGVLTCSFFFTGYEAED